MPGRSEDSQAALLVVICPRNVDQSLAGETSLGFSLVIYQVAMLIVYGSATYIVRDNCYGDYIAVKLLEHRRYLVSVGSVFLSGQGTYVKPLPRHLLPVRVFYCRDLIFFVFSYYSRGLNACRTCCCF